MKSKIKTILTVFISAFVLGIALIAAHVAQVTAPPEGLHPNLQVSLIELGDATDMQTARAANSRLKSIDGVINTHLNDQTRSISVIHDLRKQSPDDLQSKLHDAGYAAAQRKVVSAESAGGCPMGF